MIFVRLKNDNGCGILPPFGELSNLNVNVKNFWQENKFT